jgi:hypothetical protein
MPLDAHRRRKRDPTLSLTQRKHLAAILVVYLLREKDAEEYQRYKARQNDGMLFDMIAFVEGASRRSLARWAREPAFKSVHWWTTVVPQMSVQRFRRNFRVPPEVANAIHNGLAPLPQFQLSKFAPRSVAKCLSLKIAITLWRLGSVRTECDAAEVFGVSSGFVHDACEAVVQGIMDTFGHCISSLLPTTEAARKAAALELETLSTKYGRPGFKHCLGALDGTRIGIARLPDVPSQQTFSKEQQHTVAVQAVADAKRRFIDIQIGQVGTVHDSYLLRTSALWLTRHPWLFFPYFLLADTGYFLTPELIEPFGRTESLSHLQKAAFNRALSSIRGVVECAFGILKNRFRILLNGGFRRGDLDTISRWIMAACILHNMCISADDVSAPAVEPEDEDADDDELNAAQYDDFNPDEPLSQDEQPELPGREFGFDMTGLPVTGTDSVVAEGRRRRMRAFAALGFDVDTMEDECEKAGCASIWAFMNPLA